MKILILGCGAIGGYFGGRLQQAGLDVTFLVRETRQSFLLKDGLFIKSPFGNAHLQVKVVTKQELNDVYDVVFLTCKSYDLDDAIESIRPSVGAHTIIIPLLNGLTHYQKLDMEFGAEKILGGFCYLSVTMDQNANIQHLSSSHVLTLGVRQPNQYPVLAACSTKMSLANFDLKISDDILGDLWGKYTFLCAAAAANCMLRANIGQIVDARYGHQVVMGVLEECNAVASAYGFFPTAKAKQLALAQLTEKNSSFEASMYKDMKANHRTEYDHIIGGMVRKGQDAGIHTPYLLTALTHMDIYEKNRFS